VRLRQARAKPLLDELETWLSGQMPRISGKTELAKAIRHALARMRKLRPYLDHGCLEADNNGAERAMKPVAWAGRMFSSSAPRAAAKRRRSPTP
jgi:transposase